MPGTILVAATATGVQPTAALFVGGTNVLKNTNSGNDFGTPIGVIEVVEAGPGGVSSCDFTIDDPGRAISLADGQEVLFWGFTNDCPLFRGYVDHWSAMPDFGGQGRRLQVSCTGVEAWLDWYRVRRDIVQLNSPGSYFIGRIWWEAAADAAALRVAHGGVGSFGTRFAGLAEMNSAVTGAAAWDGVSLWSVWTVVAGGTLRETINELAQHQELAPTGSGIAIEPLTTVDFDLTLRVWPDRIAGGSLLQPSDYTTLTVGDTPASPLVAEDLEFANEPSDVVHETFVKGGNAAGSGLFADGTGKRGRQGLVTDPLILDAYTANVRAQAYMASLRPLVRGSFGLGPFTPAATVHAGSLVALTNDETGATSTYRIFEIRKTFLGTGQEIWRVAFGGMPASAARLIRKLTRAVAA